MCRRSRLVWEVEQEVDLCHHPFWRQGQAAAGGLPALEPPSSSGSLSAPLLKAVLLSPWRFSWIDHCCKVKKHMVARAGWLLPLTTLDLHKSCMWPYFLLSSESHGGQQEPLLGPLIRDWGHNCPAVRARCGAWGRIYCPGLRMELESSATRHWPEPSLRAAPEHKGLNDIALRRQMPCQTLLWRKKQTNIINQTKTVLYHKNLFTYKNFYNETQFFQLLKVFFFSF